MKKDIQLTLPILYTGMPVSHYDAFVKFSGLPPNHVKYINTLDGLRGHQNKLWFIDYGFLWVLKDPTLMSYAREHNIKVLRIDENTVFMMQTMVADGRLK
jgi:hypothetical protein